MIFPFALASEYYAGCRAGCPALVAVVSRGPLADVVPGLSDIDLRLVCDGVPAGGWQALGEVVLAVHRGLTRRGEDATRLLQHPPGACFLMSELADPLLVHPETRFWEWCDGDQRARGTLASLASGWSQRDETYHLRRYLSACDDWSPDPAAAGQPERCHCLGALVHYFLPALEAALTLEAGQARPGRLMALAAFREREPDHPLLRQVGDVIAGQVHDVGSDCAALCAGCRVFLVGLAPRLARALGRQRGAASALAWLHKRLEQRQHDPLLTLYDAARFSRIRQAHFRLFLETTGEDAERGISEDAERGISEGDWLLANELATMRGLLLQPALSAYGRLRWGASAAAPAEALARLTRRLNEAEVATIGRLLALSEASTAPSAALAEAVDLYPTYHRVLERLLADARGIAERSAHGR